MTSDDRIGANQSKQRTLFGSVAVACALAICSPRVAAVDSDDGADERKVLEEIVVTGSRLARSGFDSPVPITAIDADAIASSGYNNIGQILLEMPAIGVGLNASNANLNTQAGAEFINLRGLGSSRTLVLINGRRRVSGSGVSSAVDLATIPDALIESVEITTGGASAVYGADAVTGVVNVIMKKGLEGITAAGQIGKSQEGGADTFDLSVSGGTSFDEDRGAVTFGLAYSDTEPLPWHQRRYYGPGLLELRRNPEDTGPNDGIYDQIHYSNVRLAHIPYGGTFVLNGVRYTFDPDLRPMVHDAEPWGPTDVRAIGGDGWVWSDFDELRVGFERVSANTYVDYALSDRSSLYLETEFTHSETVNTIQPTFDLDLVIRRDNPFVSNALGSLMDANALSEIIMSRGNRDHGLYAENPNRNTFTVVTGMEGQLWTDWNYDLSYQYGRFDVSQRRNDRIEARFREAIDAIADPVTGEPICRDPVARANGCVALNVLGPDVANEAALEYFRYELARRYSNTQEVVSTHLSGPLFELPAGTFQALVGAEYRRETTDFQNDGLSLTNQLWVFQNSGTSNLAADVDVTDAFMEVRAPLVADKPLLRSLSVEGAIRFSDYSTIGNTTTWNLGVDWSLTDSLRIRATRATSVRAPNLNELFSAVIKSGSSNDDPCDVGRINLRPNRVENCAALGVPVGHVDDQQIGQDVFIGGNSDLEPEESVSWSLGTVITPTSLDKFRASIDYWSIDINDAITSLSSTEILERCVDLETINNVFCPFVTRRADHQITSVSTQNINVSSITAEGIDAEAVYTFDTLPGRLPGGLQLSLMGTYLLKNEELVDATNSDSLIIRDGEVTNPRWNAQVRASYLSEPFRVELALRVLSGALADVQVPSPEARDRNKVPAYTYLNLTGGYDINDRYSIDIGVNNVLDKDPPRIAETYRGGSAGALYDLIGRFFFVGASVDF